VNSTVILLAVIMTLQPFKNIDGTGLSSQIIPSASAAVSKLNWWNWKLWCPGIRNTC